MEINYLPLAILIFFIALEAALIYSWTPMYFKAGIPLFYKFYLLRDAKDVSINIDALNAALKKENLPKVVVKELEPGIFAFRQKYFQLAYTPVMRGKIELNSETKKIKVFGFLNLSIIAFLVVFIVLFGFAILPMLLIVFGVIFYFDRRSYIFIGMLLSGGVPGSAPLKL